MKIVMITGSPRKHGSTDLLAQKFIDGASTQGHTVIRFDVGSNPVHPCTACDHCVSNNGACVYQDPMMEIAPALLDADMVVFVSPLYYFGVSAQIKAVIDRFYAINDPLMQKHLKAMMISAGGDPDDWTMDALEQHFQTICRYLQFENAGVLFARGMYNRIDVEQSDFPEKAYAMGASISA